MSTHTFDILRNPHIGVLSILAVIVQDIREGSYRAGQYITAVALILSGFLLIALKIVMIVAGIQSAMILSNISPWMNIHWLIVMVVLIVLEVLEFYAIESMQDERRCYHWHTGWIAIVDGLQVYVFSRTALVSGLLMALFMSTKESGFEALIIPFYLLMAATESLYVRKFFSNEDCNQTTSGPNSVRFVQGPLMSMPWIGVLFMVHLLWVVGLCIVFIILWV